MVNQPTLYTYPTTTALSTDLRSYILSAQSAGLSRSSHFRLAVSGGSLPQILAQALLSPPSSDTNPDSASAVQFDKWHIYFADERAVPLTHEDSNYALLKSELLSKISPGAGQPSVCSIDPALLSNTQDLADAYEKTLIEAFAKPDSVKTPVFDLILLGCGPDGHTASLFPGHALLNETEGWVHAIEDSPKPPPRRITLSLPVLEAAGRVAFVATGGGKSEVLRKVFDGEEGRKLPCGRVTWDAGEKCSWFVDEAAAEGVRFQREGKLKRNL